MFHTLFVPLDGSEFSERSLPLARVIAREASSTIHLVQVHAPTVPGHLLSSTQFEYQGLDLEAYAARHREETGAHMTSLADALEADGITVRPAVLEGRVVETLAEHAASVEADLIVMTTHGRSGANRLWLGSVADGLVRHTHIPILMVRASEDQGEAAERAEPETLEHILVPLDGSDLAELILAPAAGLARATGARLTLAHVVASHSAMGAGLVPLLPDDIVRIRDQADAYLQKVAAQLSADGLTVDTHLAEGDTPPSVITAIAKEVGADLIALATHGYGGMKRAVLGSVADKVLRSSPLPLLVLRPEAEV
ncbi:MAG: universal stress protein [Gemmatimonadota bacterium]